VIFSIDRNNLTSGMKSLGYRGSFCLMLGVDDKAIENYRDAARFGEEAVQIYLRSKGIQW
jgi:hypothetical protein